MSIASSDAPLSPPLAPDGKTPVPAAANVPWNAFLGVLFIVIVFLASQLVGGTALGLYAGLRHLGTAAANDWLSGSVYAQFWYVLIAEAFTLAAIYGFLRLYRAGWALIGLRRPRWRDLGYGLLAVVPYYLLYGLLLAVATKLYPSLNVNQQQQIGFNGVHGNLPLLLTFVSLVVLPPLTEEIMVRGFLYSSLKKVLPLAYAALFTSLIFAAAHLPEGGSSGPLYVAAVDTFTLSLVLIYLREKTGSLWASITLHALKNGTAFVLLFVVGTH